MTQLYSSKKTQGKENLVNRALNCALSSSDTLNSNYCAKDSCLQVEDLNIRNGATTRQGAAPMTNFISQTNLSVNSELQVEFFQNRQKLTRFVNINCNRPEARVFSFFVEKINCVKKKWTCSIEVIAKETGRSITQTKNGIYGLRELGILKVKKNGFRECSTYSFNFDLVNPESKSISPSPPIATTRHTPCPPNNKELISIRNKYNKTCNKTYSENILKEKKEFQVGSWLPTGSALEKGLKETGSWLKVVHHAEEMRVYCLNNPCKSGKLWTKRSMNYFFFLWLKKSLNMRSKYHNLIPYVNRVKYNQNLMSKPVMQKQTYYEPEIIEKDTTAKVFYQGAMISMDEYNQLLYKTHRNVSPEQDAELDRVISEKLRSLGIRKSYSEDEDDKEKV